MRPHLPGSLRARVTLGAVAATTLALLVLTGVLATAVARDGRGAVDDELRERAASVLEDPGRGGPRGGMLGRRGGRRGPQPLLAGSGTFVQVAVGDDVVDQQGDVPVDAPAVPLAPGLRTVEIDGTPWRSLTVTGLGPVRLQLLQSLAAVDERVADLRRTVVLLGLLALALTATVAHVLTGLAVAPLARLRDSAARVGTTEDLGTPLPVPAGPEEVRALGSALNDMLARLSTSTTALQRALEATRRFAADAGHELRTPLTGLRANVDVLRRNPGLPRTERDAVLESVALEQERTIHLLDGLTALARGDAADALPREPVELADLVDAAVGAARRRHPGVDWTLEEDIGDATIRGWAGGLRLMVDNLLENAALHGRPDGRVRVRLRATQGGLLVRVDDDGPGIAEAEREGVIEAFRRGSDPRGPGTGLGLAIVAQQAELHGGTLLLQRSELGGLGAEIVLRTAFERSRP